MDRINWHAREIFNYLVVIFDMYIYITSRKAGKTEERIQEPKYLSASEVGMTVSTCVMRRNPTQKKTRYQRLREKKKSNI